MTNIKYHIVLRDKNNSLVNWKGYKDIETASAEFIALARKYNAITDGEWVFDYKRNAFTNGREYIALVETTADLLMEILFDNARTADEIFGDFLSEER